MTEDDKALVERLRYRKLMANTDPWLRADDLCVEAADRIEAQAAEIEQLRRDHAAMVKEANIAKARLKGVQKQWYADRATLEDAK